MKSKIAIIYLIIVIFGLIGYVKCIVKLCKCDFEPSYKAEILYGVGVVTEIGAVIGWMYLGK